MRKPKKEESTDAKAEEGAASKVSAVAEVASKDDTVPYIVDQDLQYLSSKFKTWVPCKVIKVDKIKNAVQINLKAGFWFKGPERDKKLRIPITGKEDSGDAGVGRCGLCSKRVLKEVGGVGGVLCKRVRVCGPAGGCGIGVCWICVKKAAPDDAFIGKIRPKKKEFEEMRAAGKNPWWMHEQCMSGADAADYAVQMKPEPEKDKKDKKEKKGLKKTADGAVLAGSSDDDDSPDEDCLVARYKNK